MGRTTTTTIALGIWENRAQLPYLPVNSQLANGARYNAFGVRISRAGDPAETRRPYKIEELADGTSYVMYDDDSAGEVPIYKTTVEA